MSICLLLTIDDRAPPCPLPTFLSVINHVHFVKLVPREKHLVVIWKSFILNDVNFFNAFIGHLYFFLSNVKLKLSLLIKEAKWGSLAFRKTDSVTKGSTDCATESWIEGCISAQLVKNIRHKRCSYVYPDIAFLYCFICLFIWLPLKLRMDHLLKAELYLAWFVNQYPSSRLWHWVAFQVHISWKNIRISPLIVKHLRSSLTKRRISSTFLSQC